MHNFSKRCDPKRNIYSSEVTEYKHYSQQCMNVLFLLLKFNTKTPRGATLKYSHHKMLYAKDERFCTYFLQLYI